MVVARPVVGYHEFRTHAGHRGKDGANLAYSELGRLLATSEDIDPRPHDLVALCRGDGLARSALEHCDVVVSAAGPHAYLYHYLRERLGLRFRIVRDVRTALWNGYLLQESLCAPYLRAEDSLIHSSAYSLALFQHLFPVVPASSCHVCYPLLRWFPAAVAGTWRGSGLAGGATVGYVGRLTEDKNFPQALDLLARLRRRGRGDLTLCVIGEAKPPFDSTRQVAERLGGDLTGYQWLPPMPSADLWARYASFDVLFFPSSSTLETFGRVIVEASHVGTPVLASSHGAATELLEPDALLPTRYHFGRRFSAHFAAPLASVDVDAAVTRLLDGPPVPSSRGHARYGDDDRRMISIVADGNAACPPRVTHTAATLAFVRAVRPSGLALPATPGEADAAIELLRARFVALNSRGRPRYWPALLELLRRSRHRGKTAQFVRSSLFGGEDFTNIGGIDLQFSHLLGFYPSFTLADGPPPDQGTGVRTGTSRRRPSGTGP